MSEPKPIAALTGSLLARKGDARPAMRRAYVPMASLATASEALHDDLGWHVGQRETPRDGTPVHRQQERIARSFSPSEAPVEPAVQPARNRAAFTLRLDAERHLRLRLASATANRSAQQLVTEALDDWLAKQPGLDALVAQVDADGEIARNERGIFPSASQAAGCSATSALSASTPFFQLPRA